MIAHPLSSIPTLAGFLVSFSLGQVCRCGNTYHPRRCHVHYLVYSNFITRTIWGLRSRGRQLRLLNLRSYDVMILENKTGVLRRRYEFIYTRLIPYFASSSFLPDGFCIYDSFNA
jgi:hypothetical protein